MDEKKKRNVTEQLRSEHIDTLEVLHSTQDENEELKSKLQNLQDKFEGFTRLYSDANDIFDLPPNSAQNKELLDQLEKNRALSSELSAAKEKLKQYQLEEQKRLLAKKDKVSVEELQHTIYKIRDKEYQNSLKIQDLEKTIEILRHTSESSKSSYEDKLKESHDSLLLFQNELTAFQHRHNEVQYDFQQLHDKHNALLKEKETLTVQVQYYKQQIPPSRPSSPTKSPCSPVHQQQNQNMQDLYHLRTYERDLKLKIEEIELKNRLLYENQQKIYEKDQKVSELQSQIYSLQQSLDDLQNLPKILQSSSGGDDGDSGLLFNDSEMVSTVIPEAMRISVKIQSQPQQQQQPAFDPFETTVVKEETMIANGSVRFQEFMKLKLENRELKLRLAELTSFPYQHQQQPQSLQSAPHTPQNHNNLMGMAQQQQQQLLQGGKGGKSGSFHLGMNKSGKHNNNNNNNNNQHDRHQQRQSFDYEMGTSSSQPILGYDHSQKQLLNSSNNHRSPSTHDLANNNSGKIQFPRLSKSSKR
jgi:hypothetical protein